MTKFHCDGDWHLEYADGEFTAADAAAADLHLAICSGCSREVAALRRSREMLTTYFATVETESSAVPYRQPASSRVSWNSAALALASLAATALLVSVFFFRDGESEKTVTSVPSPVERSIASLPSTEEPKEEDVLTMISRETQIARLRATSEILAKEPGMNDRHLAIERYLNKAYGVTNTPGAFEM
jgi:hypothetical protein